MSRKEDKLEGRCAGSRRGGQCGRGGGRSSQSSVAANPPQLLEGRGDILLTNIITDSIDQSISCNHLIINKTRCEMCEQIC